MFAELVVNIEAPLEGTFHYRVPRDLESLLTIGHLVEVEFGRRLAQGIIIRFDESAPVEDTKPIINLIDPIPVVRTWQIDLAHWLSEQYLTPLNACLRLMLPPGLTRWSDITLDLNPYWDGAGRLTETQQQLLDLLGEKGDLRGRKIARAMPKGSDWRSAASQLARRNIIRKATILDPPRVRPKMVRTATLCATPEQIQANSLRLGRNNLLASVLFYLLSQDDALPATSTVLAEAGAKPAQLDKLAEAGFIYLSPKETIVIPAAANIADSPEITLLLESLPLAANQISNQTALITAHEQGLVEFVETPAAVVLSVSPEVALRQIFALRGAGKYYDLLASLAASAIPLPLSELYAETGANLSHLKKLHSLGLIRLGEEEVWRNTLADRDFIPTTPPVPTPDQDRVWEEIKLAMQHKPAPFLLHGVTGSGKTEIYLRAADFALASGKQAIVLVPEIALTPQTVRRFASRFPDQVALLHSRLSDGERYDTWRRARDGQYKIVVGPRSALFTPFANPGIIILDEEHDHSYKQTPPVPPPYYHAREAAVELGQITGSTVILGSATPDIVTYHRAQGGWCKLVELPRRIMGHRRRIEGQAARLQRESSYQQAEGDPEDALTIPLPPVQIVDLRQELRAGNRSIFSRALRSALDDTLSRGEQAILFLNRRGTATFIMCRDCGHVLNCPRCQMPLTYHRPGALLVCHYCGRKEEPKDTCPKCGSRRIKYFGLGTEEVQRLVELEWPAARTVRWDRDTTAGRDSHEALLASFINQQADILVGTQMIAKGLDLPLVTLVGVISADVALGLPDFSIGERTFQVLAQVAGRAGRGMLGGRVIVQTYQPEHYAIKAAAEHDYTTFYLEEIRFRTQHALPPFRRLARLVIADPVDERAERQAKQLASALRRHAREKALGATEVVGPLPPFFNRIDGRYRWQIIIRSPNPARLLTDFQIPSSCVVDIDPVSTL